MPYNFVADGCHTKKPCSRLSSSKVQFYTENDRFAFEPHFGGLGATYDVYLRTIGKHVADFLLVSIELCH